MPAQAARSHPIGRAGAVRCNERELVDQPNMPIPTLLLPRGSHLHLILLEFVRDLAGHVILRQHRA
jgi:hypothetical protein